MYNIPKLHLDCLTTHQNLEEEKLSLGINALKEG